MLSDSAMSFFVKDVRYRFSDICMFSSRLVDPGSRFVDRRAILATLQLQAGSSSLNYTDSCFQHLNTLLVEQLCPTISFTLNFFSTGTFSFQLYGVILCKISESASLNFNLKSFL